MSPPEEHHLERHPYREQIGAFVLGKLEGGELEAMRAHLDGCPVCRAEVSELEPVVAALADADPDRIDEYPRPPGDLEESTFAPISGEIRRARDRGRRFGWSGLAAAAIFAVVIGLAGFAWLVEPAVALVEPLSFSVAPGMKKVEGHLIAHASGTEIRLVVFSGARDGQTYRVTLVSKDGKRVDAGTFIGAGDEPVRGTFHAALLRKDAAKLEVGTPGGEPAFFSELPEKPRDKVREWPLLGILPWAEPHPHNKTMEPGAPKGKKGPSAKDTAPATAPADTPETPKAPGYGGGTTHKGSSPESGGKSSPSPGGEPSTSAAASPTASASASAGRTPMVPVAPPPEEQSPAESPSASAGETTGVPAEPPPEDQTPAESQYGAGN